MGFIRCPFCEQVIDSDARKCFFCDSDLSHVLGSKNLKQVSGQRDTLNMHHPINLTKITLFLFLSAAFLGLVFFMIRHFD